MQLFDKNGPEYTRLDDDVSFQILRTNPRLTTNTRLMYDGENLYMDSYDATPLLATMEYKHHRVWKTGLFNRDIRNFLLGSNTAAYNVGQSVNDTIILDRYDDQFENMYWCGVEPVNSNIYPQEMGCIAPLYIRKKLPRYFVIFKIDNPSNTNMREDINDTVFSFGKDVLKNARIVKAFDLREGTPIGNYIKRYVEQRDFRYDQSVYVNFSSNEIYYYGIDKKSGVLTQKVENFSEQLLKNDNTVMKMDDWITSGFERNNLIFPYIINLEFLFDDKDIEEFRFARYFGMYCNDIDLYDIDVEESIDTQDGYTVLSCGWDAEDQVPTDGSEIYYVKDKYGGIFSVRKSAVPGYYRVPGKVDVSMFSGFEPRTVSVHAERMDGLGKAVMILKIEKNLTPGDSVIVSRISYSEEDSDSDGYAEIDSFIDNIAKFTATNQIGKREAIGTVFSCKGTVQDTASALACAIRNCEIESLQWVTAFSIDDKVIIQSIYPGTNMNGIFDVYFDRIVTLNGRISKVTGSFCGGTDYNGCMFRISSSDSGMFFDTSGTDRDSTRYLKCGSGRNNAEITGIIPYITEDRYIDDDYSVIITDEYGRYANVSKTGQVEVMDRYYAKIGVLGFFPVRDFDFDTVKTSYGEHSVMRMELDNISKYSNSENFRIPYSRFFYDNGTEAETEYDYYFENFIPELSTVNKTVPFISKWGYMDESKDSCENPYRLNMSKIFDVCNFSANTFTQKGDIMEYTHSMPYYVTGYKGIDGYENYEYHYIDIDTLGFDCSTLEGWKDFLSKGTEDGKDPFSTIFGDTSRGVFPSKRYNRKYSRFLTGDGLRRSSTLFRGVKFEIEEISSGKEVHTGKYNGYRFSFVYVPVNMDDTIYKNTVNFIKNDEYKFIVGVMFFNTSDEIGGDTSKFNKAFVYGESMGFIDLVKQDGESSGGGSNEPMDDDSPEWITPGDDEGDSDGPDGGESDPSDDGDSDSDSDTGEQG